VYGGAIACLADAAITLAAGTTVPSATAFSTIDLKLYMLRPVLPADGELIARATVAHRGRTIAIADCQITGPDGALAARATGSVLILPGRRWERPVQVADEITAESGRVLTTLLFTDIAGSTRRAAELGDDRWRRLLAEHHAIVREQIRRFRGREVDTAGDGSSSPSTAPPAPSSARPRSAPICGASAWKSGREFTRASARKAAASWSASQCTSGHDWWGSLTLARSWSPAPSKTSPPGQASNLMTDPEGFRAQIRAHRHCCCWSSQVWLPVTTFSCAGPPGARSGTG
jgi:uncharacterized protein (TIGR00369 family)